MNEIQLIEIHQIKSSDKNFKELENLCFLSKNLYNATLYAIRQEYIKSKTYLDFYKVNKLFTDNNQPDYRALPAKVSKHTQKLVHQSFISFFKLLKLKNNNKYNKRINLPNYLHKNGKQVVHYEKGALSLVKNGYIKLSKTNIVIKTKIPKNQIQFVRIVPKGNHIRLEVGYKKELINIENSKNRYASIDLGLNNLMTISSNVMSPFIINGKPLKSINQYYNKQKSKYNLLNLNKKELIELERLNLKRENKINDYIHKSTRILVNHLVSNNIDTLIIGQNIGWKQDINIGRRNNQNFVYIPFNKIIKQLIYKCRIYGIIVEIQEESYTSKCSFLDNEEICKHDIYLGKRVRRGLFRTSTNKYINADLNGSLNILKKYLIKNVAWNDTIWSDLVEASSEPNILILTPSFN